MAILNRSAASAPSQETCTALPNGSSSAGSARSPWNPPAFTGSQSSRSWSSSPGRKTDVIDAQWLQRLHEYGLLRASFRPERRIAALRDYLRQRERLLDYAASHIQHMQKALMQMNLQLHHVVSDITGATGMRIIRAVVAGERNPVTLAALRDRRCKESAETIRLTGRNTSSLWRRPWSCMMPTWPRLMPATSGLRRS
jgi:hypothetical protein